MPPKGSLPLPDMGRQLRRLLALKPMSRARATGYGRNLAVQPRAVMWTCNSSFS